MATMTAISDTKATQSTIWDLIATKDFAKIILWLRDQGVTEDQLGESLLGIVRDALAAQRFHAARTILLFLIEALCDKQERPPLIKLVGDTYSFEGNFRKAREYYGQLPGTMDNIRLVLQTFLPEIDMDGMLTTRDGILARAPSSAHPSIHALVDGLFAEVAALSVIRQAHVDRYQKNRRCVQQIDLFADENFLLPERWQFSAQGDEEYAFLRLSDAIYAREQGVWRRMISIPAGGWTGGASLGTLQDIAVLCRSLNELIAVVNTISIKKPKSYKRECYLFINRELLIKAMAVVDLAPMAHSNYIFRFIDEKKADLQLRRLLIHEQTAFPERFIDLTEGNQEFLSQILEPSIDACEREIIYSIQLGILRLTELYPDDFAKRLAMRITNNETIRVMFITSRYSTYIQYSIRDMAEGFRRLGHDVFILQEKAQSGCKFRTDVILNALSDFRPDIVFCIDHCRYETPFIPSNIPFVTWAQDMLPNLTEINDPNIFGKQDYLFSFTQMWIDKVFSVRPVYKNLKIGLLPIPVNQEIYCHIPDCEEKYDVTYVAHLVDPDQTYMPLLDGKISFEVSSQEDVSFLKQVVIDLDVMSIQERDNVFYSLEQRKNFAAKVCSKINIRLYGNKLEYLFQYLTSDRFHRHRFFLEKSKPIEYLLRQGITVRVFGKNWEKLPALSKIAMGPVENGAALNLIYNQSRINLNLNPHGPDHMKALEVMAGKNFLISKQPESQYGFTYHTDLNEDKGIVLFNNERELLSKIKHYLRNKELRDTLAATAYDKTVKHYSIDKSAKIVLNTIASHNI